MRFIEIAFAIGSQADNLLANIMVRVIGEDLLGVFVSKDARKQLVGSSNKGEALFGVTPNLNFLRRTTRTLRMLKGYD